LDIENSWSSSAWGEGAKGSVSGEEVVGGIKGNQNQTNGENGRGVRDKEMEINA
jgi:hypothetical protein